MCRYTAFGEQLTPSKLSPWRFASKRYDDETGYTYFGRRYYSPPLGRFITPDPLGFDDGPNLYAYVHNCPFTLIDLHGLWGKWGFQKTSNSDGLNRFKGANLGAQDLFFNLASGMGGKTFTSTSSCFDTSPLLGEWEDLSFHSAKDITKMGYRTALPYTYDLQHLSPDTPQDLRCMAEGKAAFEQALLFCTVAKGMQGLARIKVPIRQASPIFLTNRSLTCSGIPAINGGLVLTGEVEQSLSKFSAITPENFFGNKTYSEMKALLTKKFGPPRGVGPYNESFYNSRTGRTYNLHQDPLHRKGKPHIDIRKRGLGTEHYRDKPFFLLEE